MIRGFLRSRRVSIARMASLIRIAAIPCSWFVLAMRVLGRKMPDEQITRLNMQRVTHAVQRVEIDTCGPARIERVRGVVGDASPFSERLDRKPLRAGKLPYPHPDWHRSSSVSWCPS
ncbi:MAG TPA: hypothetical protein VFZ66_09515 [Herpetosiphonaceae bacterium]